MLIKNSGVYCITCIINNKIYIGSAVNIIQRWHVHKSALRRNKHHSKYLQRSWNKYGEASFEFKLLAYCPPEYCIKLEQWFLDSMKPEYNTLKVAGSLIGFKHSWDARVKFSNNMKTYKHSNESLEKLSKARKFTQPVNKYDLNGVFIERYESLSAAGKSINRHPSTVLDCIKGRALQSCGFTFKYADLESIEKYKIARKIKSNKKLMLKLATLVIKINPSSFTEFYKSLNIDGICNDAEVIKKLDEHIDDNNIK